MSLKFHVNMIKCALQTKWWYKNNILKNRNRQEAADQLAIYKAWKSWVRDYWKQTQLVAKRRIWKRDIRISLKG